MMPHSETQYLLAREQIVAVFSQWSTRDIVVDRNGKVDAQAQTEKFIATMGDLMLLPDAVVGEATDAE